MPELKEATPMATSPQHAAWIRRGRPWRLARPLLALRDRLRAYGYTVYDIGNDAHLNAQPPERHCPYSETNWPTLQGKPMPDVVTAIDVMPPPAGSGLPSLQRLGAQLFADRQAGNPGVAWLVGMNWGPTSDRAAVRDTWQPSHIRRSSSDTGHIHGECRSDLIDSTAGDGYDPIARLRGEPITTRQQENNMIVIAKDGTGQMYVCDGIWSRPIDADQIGHLKYLAAQGAVGPLWKNGEIWNGWVPAFGAKVQPATVDTAALAREIAAKVAVTLADDPGNELTLADVPTLAATIADTVGDTLAARLTS